MHAHSSTARAFRRPPQPVKQVPKLHRTPRFNVREPEPKPSQQLLRVHVFRVMSGSQTIHLQFLKCKPDHRARSLFSQAFAPEPPHNVYAHLKHSWLVMVRSQTRAASELTRRALKERPVLHAHRTRAVHLELQPLFHLFNRLRRRGTASLQHRATAISRAEGRLPSTSRTPTAAKREAQTSF